ncbi:PBP1A family penicillin-binding protein [bacterium]|nr:PBP1A family penicillin-binding protein [bacterium]
MKRKKRTFEPGTRPIADPHDTGQLTGWKRYAVITFGSVVALGILMIILLSRNLPSLTELESASDPVLVSRIVSSDGVVMKELYIKNRIFVPLDLIPEQMKQAVLATEDRRFYNHWGLDTRRIAKAILVDIIHMDKREGASTITQQLARHLYLSKRKIWIRKFREQLTAIQIERTYSKNEILEMYMNYMELGRGAHGVQSASLAYFDKNVEDLQIQEMAMIAGMFQLPYGPYNPDRDTLKTFERRNSILRSMVAFGSIEQAEYDSLSRLPLCVAPKQQKEEAIAPYFCEYVRQLMQNKYGRSTYTEGYTIYTSLDTRAQACAEKAINDFMPKIDQLVQQRILRKKEFTKWTDPPLETDKDIRTFLADTVRVDSLLKKYATVQCAFTAIDPKNGHILAMVGGRNFDDSKLNRAVQSHRQPGSAFKPIVFTAAIDNGWPATKEFLNLPVVLYMVDGTPWEPSNYEEESVSGPTTMRVGLARSLNLVSVRMVLELGLQQKAAWYAQRFGFTTKINPYDAIALGSDDVYPIELVSAYGVFANKGIRTEPLAILKVVDKNGIVIEENMPQSKEVLTEATAYLMTDLLRSVIQEGTGRNTGPIYHFYRPCAGKTGTTNEYRNAWFVGFTPQIVAGVWVGMDKETISLGEDRTGASTALPIWAPFMRMAHDTLNLPVENFVQPPGVVRMDVCADSKLKARSTCPKVLHEVFLKGTEPMRECDIHGTSGRPTKKASEKQVF